MAQVTGGGSAGKKKPAKKKVAQKAWRVPAKYAFRITEDDPRWNWRTMGNRRRGPNYPRTGGKQER